MLLFSGAVGLAICSSFLEHLFHKVLQLSGAIVLQLSGAPRSSFLERDSKFCCGFVLERSEIDHFVMAVTAAQSHGPACCSPWS